jgi:hypothetical protein
MREKLPSWCMLARWTEWRQLVLSGSRASRVPMRFGSGTNWGRLVHANIWQLRIGCEPSALCRAPCSPLRMKG